MTPQSAGDQLAAETRPPLADHYATWWKVWLPIPLLLVLFDVTFNAWFWHLPKLTGSAADYTYQFLYDLARLRDSKQDGAVRVVAFGSSVSSAFDPFQVQSLLDTHGRVGQVEVARLTKPGSKPSDHRLIWEEERDAIAPDVAVMVFNLVDFLNPSFERDLKPEIRYILPPWRALRERWKYIPGFTEKLALVTAGASNVYRYRKPIQSALEDNAKAAYRWMRGLRGEPGGYGWYADGFTRDRFGVVLDDTAGGVFEYFIHPAWLRQRGAVRLEFAVDGVPLSVREEREPGWKALPLDGVQGDVLHVSADSTWNPRAAGLGDDVRLLGVQLRVQPPSAQNHGSPPFRYEARKPSEVDEFLRMGEARGDAYRARWQAALDDGSEFARRFRAYRDVKLALRDRHFEPTGEFLEVERLVELLTGAGVRVVLVNTPESPLLAGLDQSPYYQAYLEFFRGLARENPRVRFVDLHDSLPAEDLNDWHHVNFVGQIKLGPVFAAVLEEEIDALRGSVPAPEGERAL